MNIDKEVNMKLFQQQQEQSRHLDYEKDFCRIFFVKELPYCHISW